MRAARRRSGVQPWPMLSPQEIDRLATYNAERYRGLVHTDEYAGQMRALQARFDAWRREGP